MIDKVPINVYRAQAEFVARIHQNGKKLPKDFEIEMIGVW